MQFLNALIWAAACAGAGAVTLKKWILPQQRQKAFMVGYLLLIVVAAGITGWFAYLRSPQILVQIRLLFTASALCCAAAVDLFYKKIPNACSLWLLAGFAVVTAAGLIFTPELALSQLAASVLGGVGMLALLGFFRLVSRGGIGIGDIKLLSSVGMVLGLYGTICLLVFAQLFSLVAAVALLVSRRAGWKDSVPFAPFFGVGFVVCVLLGTF